VETIPYNCLTLQNTKWFVTKFSALVSFRARFAPIVCLTSPTH